MEKISEQNSIISAAEIELQDLARIKIREDELENLCIALRREKEESGKNLVKEIALLGRWRKRG